MAALVDGPRVNRREVTLGAISGGFMSIAGLVVGSWGRQRATGPLSETNETCNMWKEWAWSSQNPEVSGKIYTVSHPVSDVSWQGSASMNLVVGGDVTCLSREFDFKSDRRMLPELLESVLGYGLRLATFSEARKFVSDMALSSTGVRQNDYPSYSDYRTQVGKAVSAIRDSKSGAIFTGEGIYSVREARLAEEGSGLLLFVSEAAVDNEYLRHHPK